jgi:hypothetical protein
MREPRSLAGPTRRRTAPATRCARRDSASRGLGRSIHRPDSRCPPPDSENNDPILRVHKSGHQVCVPRPDHKRTRTSGPQAGAGRVTAPTRGFPAQTSGAQPFSRTSRGAAATNEDYEFRCPIQNSTFFNSTFVIPALNVHPSLPSGVYGFANASFGTSPEMTRSLRLIVCPLPTISRLTDTFMPSTFLKSWKRTTRGSSSAFDPCSFMCH